MIFLKMVVKILTYRQVFAIKITLLLTISQEINFACS